MGLVHKDEHGRVIYQRWVFDEAAKDIRAEHPVAPCLHERSQALYVLRKRRIWVLDRPSNMCWIIEHIPELGLKEDPAAVGEITSGFLCVRIGLVALLALLDDRKRRSGPNKRLLARSRMYFEMLDSARNREARDASAKTRIVGSHNQLRTRSHKLGKSCREALPILVV
jgi:hypothetical protein